MVKTLYLIRHGETEGSEERRYKGAIDVPLSEKGMRQMEGISKYIVELTQNRANLSSPPFSKGGMGGLLLKDGKAGLLDAVYCSDLRRAVRGAEIIAEPFGLSPVKIKELRERDFGVWEGMSFAEIKERYPDDFNAWIRNPLKFSPTGGESILEFRDRVIQALEEILHNRSTEHRVQTHDKGTVPDLRTKQSGVVESGLSPTLEIAIVAHGGVNRIILCQFLGIPLENIFRIEQDYGAVNIIEFYDGYPVVKLINYAV